MSDRVMQSLVHAVRRRAAEDPAAGSDAELLSRFVLSRDPSAFELLVWRHGAMVEAVCRRILGRSADVEDAFQATFMALLKQAKSIRRQTSAAPWLHRVALRVSLRLQRSADRRSKREKASVRTEVAAGSDPDSFELGRILHEEIDRLPERFRLPLVMCLLEGRGVAEASCLLGVPRGTILSRLSRARERLRRALIHRGIAPAAAAALALAETDKGVSASLVRITLQSINQLTSNAAAISPVARVAEGVVRDMMLKKIRMGVCVAAVVGLIGAGAAFVSLPQAQAQPERPGGVRRASDMERMQGSWSAIAVKRDGRTENRSVDVVVKGTNLTISQIGADSEPASYSISLDRSQNPRSIDLQADGRTLPGIYEFNGDNLKLCFCERGSDRPDEFASQRGAHVVLMTLKRHAGPVVIGSVAADDVDSLRAENARLRQLLAEEKARNSKLVAQLDKVRADLQSEEAAQTHTREIVNQIRRQIQQQQSMAETQRAMAATLEQQALKEKLAKDQLAKVADDKNKIHREAISDEKDLLALERKQRELAELQRMKALEAQMQAEANAKLLELNKEKTAGVKADAERAIAEIEKRLLVERDLQRAMAEMAQKEALEARRQAEASIKSAMAERDRLAAALEQAKAAVAEAQRQLQAERNSYVLPSTNRPLDVGVKPDCEVEWKENWYPAKVVKKEKDRWLIHYVGYEQSWDEWVGKERIRFPEKK
jgi:RNA polymerase sigma factor (sigma-70 family)